MGLGDYPYYSLLGSTPAGCTNPAGSFSGITASISVDAETSATYAVAPSDKFKAAAFFTITLPFYGLPYIGVYGMGFDAGVHIEVCVYGIKNMEVLRTS